MNDINFYDPSLRYRHDWTSTGTALALLAATAVVVMAITLAVRHESKGLQAAAADGATATRSRKEILAVLEARYNQLKTDATLERRLLLLQSTLAHRRADLNLLDGAALHETGGYSTTLLALARQSVDGLWLTGIAMDHGNMTLRGRTVRPDLIAVYVGRLNAEPALHGQAFRELDIRRPVDDTAAAGAAPTEAPPVATPATGTARRLAPYVEFSLTGGRESGAESGIARLAEGTAASTEPRP